MAASTREIELLTRIQEGFRRHAETSMWLRGAQMLLERLRNKYDIEDADIDLVMEYSEPEFDVPLSNRLEIKDKAAILGAYMLSHMDGIDTTLLALENLYNEGALAGKAGLGPLPEVEFTKQIGRAEAIGYCIKVCLDLVIKESADNAHVPGAAEVARLLSEAFDGMLAKQVANAEFLANARWNPPADLAGIAHPELPAVPSVIEPESPSVIDSLGQIPPTSYTLVSGGSITFSPGYSTFDMLNYAGQEVTKERDKRLALVQDLREYMYRIASLVPFDQAQAARERGEAILAALKS